MGRSIYIVMVDGEEIDHADDMRGARVARNAIIYGGIGTIENTSIERR